MTGSKKTRQRWVICLQKAFGHIANQTTMTNKQVKFISKLRRVSVCLVEGNEKETYYV